jgi:TetR/AcrR family transcriptional regulator, ethionamide resistance regulator
MAATVSTDLGSRNPTEDAILAAAREALLEEPYDAVTIDGIARRAYVSRTTVYFYFPNKRAVVDRLIQRAFADILKAASPYLEGEGDPRAELHAALAGVVAIVDRDASILRLALWLYGREDQLPAEWAPHIQRLVVAGAKRIARDQKRGLAPDDIPARTSALALSAMVERHVGMEIVRSGRDGHESIRVLSELWWRAVYSKPGD